MDDRSILRKLATQYMEIATEPGQNLKRQLWRELNSLRAKRPAIYVRAFAWHEMPDSKCHCCDPFFRGIESHFRNEIFRSGFGDDYIIEPWLKIPAVHLCYGWGVAGERHFAEGETKGSYKEDYPLKNLSDITHLRPPVHSIDEEATRQNHESLKSAIGDIIPIEIDRGPAYRMWTGDISTELGHLRGIENFMLDMMDSPDELHALLAFMRDGIFTTHAQAEAAGDWGLICHENQAMPYSMELNDPVPGKTGIQRKELWCFMASQEYTCVSPEMFDEFLLQYQLPILAKFGLTAYGCCEDLTRKISLLKKIPNLRRIAVSPFAKLESCVAQAGQDYVLSYRPSPADMVSYGFDESRIRKILRRDFAICRDSYFDVTLKDVETVQNDPERIRKWVRVVRDELESSL